MTDYTHLDSLLNRLAHEQTYAAAAQSKPEIRLRGIWIKQIEREIAAERKFLGLADDLDDDELIAALCDSAER